MAVAVPARVGSERAPVAWCLEVHDLVLSKCAAGRDRDWDYAREALRAGIVRGDLVERVALLPVLDEARDHVKGMRRAIIAGP